MYDSDLVVADMHDGDQKAITFQSCECTVPCECTMTIKPHANNQTWQVQVPLHVTESTVSGVVDFNVPGKPGPPPCNLTVTLFVERGGRHGQSTYGEKRTLEFTDHTGTITKDPHFPLNTWVELVTK